jgi:hypothetical protein
MKTKSSKNYDWFKFYSNNRPISRIHLNNLRKQFEKYGNITETSPITVNPNGFIMDGQHRRILCEEFDYPVFYNENNQNKELTAEINAYQRPWTNIDFINFFAAFKPEYGLLLRFMKDNHVTFPIASAVIFSKVNSYSYANDMGLKNGSLEVSPYIQGAQKNMDIILEIGEKMGSYMTERYVRGIMKCLYNKDFDVKRFMKKLETVMNNSPTLPNPRLTAITDVMRNLETIYNYKSTESNTVVLFR